MSIIRTGKGILDRVKLEPIKPDKTILDKMREIDKRQNGIITQKYLEDIASVIFAEPPQGFQEVKLDTPFGTLHILKKK